VVFVLGFPDFSGIVSAGTREGVGRDQVKPACCSDSLNPVSDLKLLVDIGQMEVHCSFRYDEPICCFLAAASLSDEAQYPDLCWSKPDHLS
jgi:hypothetical protein